MEGKGSQLLHLDHEGPKIVKIFINLTKVTYRDGPLTVYSASDSSRIRIQNDLLPGRKYPDSVASGFNPFVATGEVGEAIILDTARCLHYGSRVLLGGRRVCGVLTFASKFTSRFI